MNPFREAKTQSIVASESGQMAIFIALIFQVLFVFFAMVVNVGLIVHDKINLQNSVDLGAYYAAQQQAMQLNEIAHINYQIRQDYKLLAWRLRVLGMLGKKDHPIGLNAGEDIQAPPGFAENIGACISNRFWKETPGTQNLCDNNEAIPEIPRLPVVSPFPINVRIAGIIDKYRDNYRVNCNNAGPINWHFAALANAAFKLSVGRRKEMIWKISSNLSRSLEKSGGFVDRDNVAVYEGMEKTILKNLTKSNRDGQPEIAAYNGLSNPNCGTPTEKPKWLSDITITPVVPYLDLWESGGCNKAIKIVDQPPRNGNGIDAALIEYTREPPPNDPRQSSRGFEKDPWCLAYVGIRAKTRPRKPFAPFGQPITLEARSFAMPFGGTIGPWDKKGWAPGANQSTGEPVDAMAAPRKKSSDSTYENNRRYSKLFAVPRRRVGLEVSSCASCITSIRMGASPRTSSKVHDQQL